MLSTDFKCSSLVPGKIWKLFFRLIFQDLIPRLILIFFFSNIAYSKLKYDRYEQQQKKYMHVALSIMSKSLII